MVMISAFKLQRVVLINSEEVELQVNISLSRYLHPGISRLFVSQEMFSRLSDSSKRELGNTRSDLEIPMRKSANGQKCFSYKGATMWNRLSQESKLSPTLKTFKKSIANHAFN